MNKLKGKSSHHNLNYLSLFVYHKCGKLLSPCVTPQSTNFSPFRYCRASKSLYISNIVAITFHEHQLTSNLLPSPCIVADFTTMASSLSSFLHLSPIFFLLALSLMICVSAQGPPSPDYYPSSKISPVSFDQGFRNLWGPQHQSLDQGSLTIWLDSKSGMKICLTCSTQFHFKFNHLSFFFAY